MLKGADSVVIFNIVLELNDIIKNTPYYKK